MTILDQAKLEELRPYFGRSLRDAEDRVGDILSHIDELCRIGRKPSVLEIGHGFGTVLVQLLQRYGDAIDLHAVSDQPYWGSWSVLKHNAEEIGLASRQETDALPEPTIHVADINNGLPFPSGRFDFIFSQVCFHMLREKLKLLEECSRVLECQGSARIDVHPVVSPHLIPELANSIDIRADGRQIDFWRLVESVSWMSRKKASLRDYVEISASVIPDLKARLRSSIDLGDLSEKWYGVKCIYDLAEDVE